MSRRLASPITVVACLLAALVAASALGASALAAPAPSTRDGSAQPAPDGAQPAPDGAQPAPTAPDGSAQPAPDSAPPTADDAQPTGRGQAAPDDAQPATGGAQPTSSAQPASATTAGAASEERDEEIGDQAVAAQVGLAGGGRVTPGGLRIAGHYLYQLSERDWFDGAATFTFGSGQAACFRDRMDQRICGHGIADGIEVEVAASVRRVFAPQGAFRPYARAGLGLGLIQFGDDDVSGVALTLHGGGGVRVKVAPAIAVTAEGDLALGLGSFGKGVGSEPQLGLGVTAGVEFRLR